MNQRNYRQQQTTNNGQWLFDLAGLVLLGYNVYLNSQQIQAIRQSNAVQARLVGGLDEVNRELDVLNSKLKKENGQ